MLITQVAEAAQSGDIDFSITMAKAAEDLILLKEKHQAAEKAMGAAESERQRAQQLMGDLNSRASLALSKLRAAKKRWLEQAAAGLDDKQFFQEVDRLRAERQRLTDTLGFVGSWTFEDANRGCLQAELDERSGWTAWQEARCAKARLNLMAAAGAALAADPGASVSLEASWSTQVMGEVNRIRTIEIPRLKQALKTHDARVEQERSLVGMNLFA